MKLLLNASYDDKDMVKKLGAYWNPTLKKWYVQNEQDYEKFIPWILQGQEETYIIKDYFYLIFVQKHATDAISQQVSLDLVLKIMPK